ncbi:hypothetical protein AB0M10_33945 [Streptomyces sp. NPDC051840]|uniref:hypothetical protein n=1 Tax=Streptomyces sp. NPDC051840 TaxID=3154752 RepID=UPI003444CA1B
MTILVTLAVTLRKPSDWTTAFGVEGRAAIRKDVKAYVGREFSPGGVFADGEVEAEVKLR